MPALITAVLCRQVYAGNTLEHMYSDSCVHPGGLALMALDYNGYQVGPLPTCSQLANQMPCWLLHFCSVHN